MFAETCLGIRWTACSCQPGVLQMSGGTVTLAKVQELERWICSVQLYPNMICNSQDRNPETQSSNGRTTTTKTSFSRKKLLARPRKEDIGHREMNRHKH